MDRAKMPEFSEDAKRRSSPRVTHAQRRMLQLCLTHRTVNSDTLANLLFVSPDTIRSHFKALHEEFKAHERFTVVIAALTAHLIELP